jgi:hypothetical protein
MSGELNFMNDMGKRFLLMDFKKKKLKIINFYNPMKNKIKNRKAEC